MKLYIAGPMTGIPQFNFPEFDRAAARLRAEGHTIITPSELDDEETRRCALASPDGAPGSGTANNETWGDFLARDVKLLADEPDLDGVAVLPNWVKSRGARLEVFVALLCKKRIWEYVDGIDAGGTLQELPDEQVLGAIANTGPNFVKGWRQDLAGSPTLAS